MSYIGKTYKHLNGIKLRITDIDFATNTYVGRNTVTGLIELVPAEEFHRGLWVLAPEEPLVTFGAKCECGTTITLGKDDRPEYHSDYCPIFRKVT